MQPTKEEVELKKFNKLKKKLSALVEEYKRTQEEEIQKEILEILFSVATSYGGMKIDIGKPPSWRDWKEKTGKEWDGSILMIATLKNVYKRLKNNNIRIKALELFNIAAILLEDT